MKKLLRFIEKNPITSNLSNMKLIRNVKRAGGSQQKKVK